MEKNLVLAPRYTLKPLLNLDFANLDTFKQNRAAPIASHAHMSKGLNRLGKILE